MTDKIKKSRELKIYSDVKIGRVTNIITIKQKLENMILDMF